MARNDRVTPRWPLTKICKQFLFTVIFLCSTGVAHLAVPKLNLTPRQISPLATMWDQTWLLVCRSLLWAVYGLSLEVWIPRGRGQLWPVRSWDESEIKVSKIKGIVAATWNSWSVCVIIQNRANKQQERIQMYVCKKSSDYMFLFMY